ncbi:MAG: hypothetical protein IBJ18_13115 [Phycisphaerales bacterium]|nr:hypothetical protein [Phycisphaerales bacterium]
MKNVKMSRVIGLVLSASAAVVLCGGCVRTNSPTATTANADTTATTASSVQAPSEVKNTSAAKFPEDWIGHWRGEARAGGPGSRPGASFIMELIVQPLEQKSTGDERRWTWTIVYDGAQGRQERAYLLIEKDRERGRYVIDEGNSIVLDAVFLQGGLYSQFALEQVELSSAYRLMNFGGVDERLTLEILTHRPGAGTKTGGGTIEGTQQRVPEVTTFAPISLQRAEMKRVEKAGTRGSTERDLPAR